MKKIMFSLLIMLLVSSGYSFGDEKKSHPFEDIANDAVSFFAPLSGLVIGTGQDGAVIGIGSKEGVREGMRLKVFRQGDEFKHPVTGEPLGKIETEIGDVEVASVGDDSSNVFIMNGEALPGDRVRISRGTLRVLYYQTREVDWAIGDGLFRSLKNTGRFDIEEVSKNRDDLNVMLEEMKANSSVFGIFVQQRTDKGRAVVKVSFYHPDGKRFYEKEVALSDQEIGKLKFGYNYLKQVDTSTSTEWVIEVSSSMERITACDVDGDGNNELVAFSGGNIEVMRLDKELVTAFSKEIGGDREAIRLDCGDLDGDGKAEIAATFMRGYEEPGDDEDSSITLLNSSHSVESMVYSLGQEEITEVAAENGFMSIVENELYVQSFDGETGFSGKVYLMSYEGKGIEKRNEAPIPSGVNIYDFYPAGDGIFFIDAGAYVNFMDRTGAVVWRSGESLGGFIQSYLMVSPTVMIKEGRWEVKDRIVPYAQSLLMIKREPWTTTAEGLGYSSTDIMEVASKDGSITMTTVLGGINGTVHDFTVIEDKLVLLVRHSFAKKFMDIFKGKSPFKRNLYLFPLKED